MLVVCGGDVAVVVEVGVCALLCMMMVCMGLIVVIVDLQTKGKFNSRRIKFVG